MILLIKYLGFIGIYNKISKINNRLGAIINLSINSCLRYKVAKRIDEKIDDGIYNKGAFRSYGTSTSDPYVLTTDGKCSKNNYRIN
ncbi:MAG TPA: hypothetical protein VLL98_05300 [Rickettsiales bacterium]|nr:hypothetical protein [Rickettsiales bacterium]